MDYFTFLGTGGINGYSEINYAYNGNDFTTQFVQLSILKFYANDIDRMVVFCTDISFNKYAEQLKKAVASADNCVAVEFVKISADISSVDFISEILGLTRSDEIIIDVTHIFRDIPMKMLFMIKYIEQSKNIRISHLFYGKITPNEHKGILLDLIDDYHTQELSQALYLFDKTLYLSPDVLESYAVKDQRVEELLETMSQLNKYLETCNYESTLRSCHKILKKCQTIAKKPDDYYVLVPFIERIIQKFSPIENGSNFMTGIILIRILLENGKLQTAITFADNLFRVSLIDKSVDNPQRVFRSKNSGNDIYYYSQELMYGARGYECMNGDGRTNNKVTGIILNQKLSVYLKQNSKIGTFYSNIRNKVNHAGKVDKAEAEEATLGLLEVIEKMETLVKGVAGEK